MSPKWVKGTLLSFLYIKIIQILQKNIIDKLRILMIKVDSRARWLTPVIPALWEAGGSRGKEIDTVLVNMMKPRLY